MARSSLLLLTLAFTGPLALGQTSTPHRSTSGAAAHHTGPTSSHTAHKPAGPPCATLPAISPTIPALPAGIGCPKVLFTVADRLEYLNPIAERFRSSLFAELPVVISLAYADIVTGNGDLAKPQQYYMVKYTGYLTDGTKFDASDKHDETKSGFTFPYGAHRVIAGWDLGFEGMHVGGKRRLYIPYQFAYGAAGQPPKIPAKSMLIFDMELLSQSEQPPTPPKPAAPPAAPSTPNSSAPTPSTPSSTAPGSTPQTSPDVKPVPPTAGQPSTSPSSQPADVKPRLPQQ